MFSKYYVTVVWLSQWARLRRVRVLQCRVIHDVQCTYSTGQKNNEQHYPVVYPGGPGCSNTPLSVCLIDYSLGQTLHVRPRKYLSIQRQVRSSATTLLRTQRYSQGSYEQNVGARAGESLLLLVICACSEHPPSSNPKRHCYRNVPVRVQ